MEKEKMNMGDELYEIFGSKGEIGYDEIEGGQIFDEKITPEEIFSQHEKAVWYKSDIGDKGLFEQTRLNERFYAGDQWHGAKVSKKMPLCRHNIIRRIGEYKRSAVTGKDYEIRFSAEGVPTFEKTRQSVGDIHDLNVPGKKCDKVDDEVEYDLCMDALGSHFKAMSEKAELRSVLNEAFKNAFISGTGVVYCYWDNEIRTGQYADNERRQMIMGDVAFMAVDIENVDFGDPNEADTQSQPYIIISERISVKNAREQAMKYGASKEEIEKIRPDYEMNFMSGDYGESEPFSSQKLTALTKMFKIKRHDGEHIMAIKVCKGAVIRPLWDMRIRKYPIAVFRWDSRRNCAYGESEVSYLIPNQIAINRVLTAGVWATMLNGMPMMMVNSDVIHSPVTNSPGQIISFSGESDEFANAVKYIQPPDFSENFSTSLERLINDTLDLSGATRSALGMYEMNNASAIENLQNASRAPLELIAQGFKKWLCEIALIFADFVVCCYGVRKLCIEKGNDRIYLPFDAKRYSSLVITARAELKNDETTETEGAK